MRDNALGMLSEYSYDNNGNMNGERYSEINATGEPRIYQNAHIQYDELNRKVHVWDEAYSIKYEYYGFNSMTNRWEPVTIFPAR